MIAAEAAAKADFKAVDPERKAAKREEATAKAGYDDLVSSIAPVWKRRLRPAKRCSRPRV
jgi:hypothetical protein